MFAQQLKLTCPSGEGCEVTGGKFTVGFVIIDGTRYRTGDIWELECDGESRGHLLYDGLTDWDSEDGWSAIMDKESGNVLLCWQECPVEGDEEDWDED